MYQISILLPQHCYAGSVTGFIDILLFANQLAERKGQAALFGWTLCSQQAEPVQSASGILLQADGDFSLACGRQAAAFILYRHPLAGGKRSTE
ncbi:hypothetical protein [Aquitalea palustris]|uniref:hypothetical protein n=1 Tax=Aquitalea palustris TaxID=2480983 RepID=UPI00131478B4|nr:hypothetical protein [Aquitalea palustris]